MNQDDELHEKPVPVLDWVHEVSHLTRKRSEAAYETVREATTEELVSVAEAMRVISCGSVQAKYQISARAKGRFVMRGSVKGEVVQSCVVSLEPVTEKVNEDFEVEFWPAAQIETAPGEEIELGPDDLEARDVEPIHDDVLEAGRVVYEVLASGLNPYPRAEGVSFTSIHAGNAGDGGADEPETRENPFAVLEKLKGKG